MPLDDFFNKIVALDNFDIQKETISIINENSEFLLNLLRGQLSRGRDGRGKPVTLFGKSEYKKVTVLFKKEFGIGLGKETDVITNYMHGYFYQEMNVKTIGDNFEVTSDVEYFRNIILRSGQDIMELDLVSLKTFSDEILIPKLQQRFNTAFNGV